MGKALLTQSREKFQQLPETGGCLLVSSLHFSSLWLFRSISSTFLCFCGHLCALVTWSSQRTDTSFIVLLLSKPFILHTWLQCGFQHGGKKKNKVQKLSPSYVRRRTEEVYDSSKSVIQTEKKLLPYGLVSWRWGVEDIALLILCRKWHCHRCPQPNQKNNNYEKKTLKIWSHLWIWATYAWWLN